jgi:two-component system, OmpR family, response regulator
MNNSPRHAFDARRGCFLERTQVFDSLVFGKRSLVTNSTVVFVYCSPMLNRQPDMRILVVEDDKKIASFVVNGLKQSGFAVDHCPDGEQGLIMARATSYDAAVVDVMLPKLDGLSLVQQLRQDGIATPVIILSAKASVDDRVKGLQSGGDDYLTKPFAFSELLARVQALIRRANHATEPTRLVVADLTLDLLSREVTRAGQKIELQSREFSLLEYLMRHVGRVVTKTMILEHVWDYSFDPQTNVVDVLVHRLRSKVDKDFPRKMIQTLRGVGYVLRAG